MHQLDIALAVTAAVLIAVAVMSRMLERSPLQAPTIAVIVGFVVGRHGFGWMDVATPRDESVILEHAARLTLAIALMGVALRLRRRSVAVLFRPVALLLTVAMTGMWLTSSALTWWLLDVRPLTALVIGAAVTPTDPVVATTIVTGSFAKKHLPVRVRDALSFEAGANDGLAYLFVMLPVALLTRPDDQAWSHWFVDGVVVGVGAGIVVGCAAGFTAAKLLAFAERSKTVERTSLLGLTIALALFVLGASTLLKADALASVFAAGVVFNVFSRRREEHEEKHIQEAIAKLFTLPMFVVFGSLAPAGAWMRMGWPLLALVVLVLLLRRPPVVLALTPLLRSWIAPRDTAYVAWFGPIGIAAIYYAAFATAHVHDPVIWHATSAIVAASLIAHGVTAMPLTRLYGRDVPSTPPLAKPLETDDEDDDLAVVG